MRRWLTIFLLFVLPVQYAWSAAAPYCQHEQAPAKTHIGHHAHEHHADGDAGTKASGKHLGDPSPGKSGKLVGDNDCGYCNLSFAKPMKSVAPQLDSLAAFNLDPAFNPAFSSREPDMLERPNWLAA
jgi:hypothetical protein